MKRIAVHLAAVTTCLFLGGPRGAAAENPQAPQPTPTPAAGTPAPEKDRADILDHYPRRGDAPAR